MPPKKVKKEPVEPVEKPVKEEAPPDAVSINANLNPDELHLHDQRPE